MIVKLLTEHHLEFLSLKGGCRGSFKSTLVKMSNCWKSHAAAQLFVPDNLIMAADTLNYVLMNSLNCGYKLVELIIYCKYCAIESE